MYPFITWISWHHFGCLSLMSISHPCPAIASWTRAPRVLQCTDCRQISFPRLRSYIFIRTPVGWICAGHAVNKNYCSIQQWTIEAWLVEQPSSTFCSAVILTHSLIISMYRRQVEFIPRHSWVDVTPWLYWCYTSIMTMLDKCFKLFLVDRCNAPFGYCHDMSSVCKV